MVTRPILLLSLSLLCAGCGANDGAGVTGKVLYDGQPLTTGSVTFHPVASGPLAIGDIQSDGTYSLSVGTESGLPPGEYRVTVGATGPMPEPTVADPMPLPQSLIPARYGDVNTSGLKYTVAAGKNTIDISLGKE